MKKLVILSGGFDPLHVGHISMIKDAGNHGNVMICLNSDEWLTRKKGKPFMNWNERCEIIRSIKYVMDVVGMDDSDGTACDGIQYVYDTFKNQFEGICFGNGGDRNNNSTPSAEQVLCERLGIELLWNVGGSTKPQSSSWVLDKWKEPPKIEKPWGHYIDLKKCENYKIKELIVEPKQRLSLQYHNYRSELWMVVKGTVLIQNGDCTKLMSEGNYIHINKGVKHRIENTSNEPSVIAEIQFGDKIDEEDIVRVVDDYGR